MREGEVGGPCSTHGERERM